jgi:hypothetical protein
MTQVSDRDELLSMLQESRKELASAIQGLPDDKLTAPLGENWCTKDIMGHIASWDEFTVSDLRRIARGRLPCLAAFREPDVDSWNAFLMRPRRLFPLPQIRAEFEEARAEMVAALKDLPEGLLAQGQMVRNIFAIMSNHEKDHARQVREWRQAQGL